MDRSAGQMGGRRVDRSAGRRVDRLEDRMGGPTVGRSAGLMVGRWEDRMGGPRVDRRVDRSAGLTADRWEDRMGGRSAVLKVVVTMGVRGGRAVGLEPSQAWFQVRARAWRCSRASMEREEGRPLGVRALVQKQVAG